MKGSLFVFFFSLSVYLLSLTPSVSLHDSGEMITASYSLGVAHPPGYPLYCIFGKLLMSIIPIGNIAFRMNFFSCISSSLTCFFLYFIALRLFGDKIIGITISLSFAFSRIFWQQTEFAEKYTLNALFLAILILLLILFKETRRQKWLLLFSFVLGLSFSHHFQTIFIIPSAIFLILSTLRKTKKLNYCFFLSFLFFLYFFIFIFP